MALTNLSPVVVLVDELENGGDTIKSWLEDNGYHVRKVAEIYDALEEVTDITLERRPSMILLNSYLSAQDCSWIIDSLYASAREQYFPIISLSEINDRNVLTGIEEHFIRVENFDLLKPLMQTFLPVPLQARAVA